MSAALVRRTLPAFAMALMAALAVSAPASAATVVNGDFESGDLTGWTQFVTPNGTWSNYTGTTNPANAITIAAPPQGARAVVSGQSGGGTRILYQDIALEPGQLHTLNLQAYYTNSAGSLISPATLATNVPNQQFRIDVMRTTAAVDSVDPADILATIFRTQPGDPNTRGPFALTGDLSAFAGQTVRLRFAEADNQLYFSASMDDVRITSVPDGLVASPDTLAFGGRDIDDGPAADLTSTLTNTTADPITFSSLSMTGGTTQFERLTGATGDCTATTTLAAAETCDVRVRFDPTTTGAKSATLTVVTDTGDRTVALTGAGTQTESTVSLDELAFGSFDLDDGPTASQSTTVTNSGTEPVTLSGLTLSGDGGEFERLTGNAGDCTTTTTLAATETCDVRVRFDPTTTGAKAATLTIASNTPDHTVALTGTGTQTELTRSPDTLDFGSLDIDDGPTAGQNTTVTNSGTQPVTLSGLTLTGDDGEFERLTGDTGDCTTTTTLAAAETCDVRVRFDPTTTGAKAATLTIASDVVADLTVALTGTGTQSDLSPSPTALDFGSLDIDDGPAVSQNTTVTNSGTQPVTFSGLTITGDDGEFERLTGDTGDCTITTTLAATETCDVRVRFDPTSTGARAATLTIASDTADRVIALTGAGMQTELSHGPSSLTFSSRDIDDGSSVAQDATVTNSGTEPVALSGISMSGDTAQFHRSTSRTTDCTAATTLAAGQACEVSMRFDPDSTGAKTATVTITSDVPDITIALSGSGTHAEAATQTDTATTSPPAAGAPPAVTPPLANVTDPWTLARLAGPRVTQTRSGTRVNTGFVAACPAGGPACRGVLTLKLLRRSPTTGKVLRVFLTDKVTVTSMPAGTQLRVRFVLNKRGARLLRRIGSVTARLRGSLRTGAERAVVRATTFRISAPPRRP